MHHSVAIATLKYSEAERVQRKVYQIKAEVVEITKLVDLEHLHQNQMSTI